MEEYFIIITGVWYNNAHPQNVHVLISGICESVTSCGKKGLCKCE